MYRKEIALGETNFHMPLLTTFATISTKRTLRFHVVCSTNAFAHFHRPATTQPQGSKTVCSPTKRYMMLPNHEYCSAGLLSSRLSIGAWHTGAGRILESHDRLKAPPARLIWAKKPQIVERPQAMHSARNCHPEDLMNLPPCSAELFANRVHCVLDAIFIQNTVYESAHGLHGEFAVQLQSAESQSKFQEHLIPILREDCPDSFYFIAVFRPEPRSVLQQVVDT